jgi:hypothetical protein
VSGDELHQCHAHTALADPCGRHSVFYEQRLILARSGESELSRLFQE